MLESLIETMEATERCILRYEPELGWSATNVEGCDNAALKWYREPISALDAMTGKQCTMTQHEGVITAMVRHRGQHWAAEWWRDKYNDVSGEWGSSGLISTNWIRPFVAPTRVAASAEAG